MSVDQGRNKIKTDLCGVEENEEVHEGDVDGDEKTQKPGRPEDRQEDSHGSNRRPVDNDTDISLELNHRSLS